MSFLSLVQSPKKEEVEMILDRSHRILDLAKCERWGFGVQRVDARLRIAINSLERETPLASLTPERFAELLDKNHGVRRILDTYTDEQVAFAIRDATS